MNLADETKKHGVTLHAFADDMQLCLHCCRDDMASTALQLKQCFTDVGHWMSAWSWMPTRPSCSGPDPGDVAFPCATMVPSYSSEKIPLFLPTTLKCSEWHCRSSDLTMDKHISNICSARFYRLWQLRCVRRSLDMELAATLMHAFITSRIDYCNVLLAGELKATTDKLQCLLNAAALLLSGIKKFDRGLSQVIHVDLHWLDIPERVKYKLVTMARLLCTWPTAALVSQMLRHGVICVLPVVVNYSSLDTISPHMVIGLFLSRVQLHRTACAMNYVNHC